MSSPLISPFLIGQVLLKQKGIVVLLGDFNARIGILMM